MLSLGDINFGLGVDTSNMVRSIQTITRFGDEVERAARRTGDGAVAAAAALRRQEAAALSALNTTLNLYSRIISEAPQATALINENERAFGRLVSGMTAGRASALSFQRSMESFRIESGNVARTLNILQQSQVQFFSQSQQGSARLIAMAAALRSMNEAGGAGGGLTWGVALRDMASAATLTLGPLSGAGSRLLALSQIVTRSNALVAGATIGFSLMTYAIAKWTTAAIENAIIMNTINQRLVAITGNQAAAALTLENLHKLADQTGISFVNLAQNFSSFQASAQGTSLSAAEVANVFRDISIAAAQFHLSAEQTDSVFLALEQMLSKGVVSMQELRQQLGNALPGAFSIMAQAMGVTTQKLNELVQTGALASDVAVPKFAKALREAVGADVNTRVDTLISAQGRLTNAINENLTVFDRVTSASSLYKTVLEGLTHVIEHATVGMKNLAGISPLDDAIKSTKAFADSLQDARVIDAQMVADQVRSAQIRVNGISNLIAKQKDYIANLQDSVAQTKGLSDPDLGENFAAALAESEAKLVEYENQLKITLYSLDRFSEAQKKITSGSNAPVLTERQAKEIEKIQELIKYNNDLGVAMQKSRADGVAMQRTLEDTKAYDQMVRGLKDAGVTGQIAADMLKNLASSQNVKRLGELAVAMEDLGRETKQNFVQAGAGSFGALSGVGDAFQKLAKTEDDISNKTRQMYIQLRAAGASATEATNGSRDYEQSLRRLLDAEQQIALVEIKRTADRTGEQASALEEVTGLHIQSADALERLNRAYERDDARRKFFSDLILQNESIDTAISRTDEYITNLDRIQDAKDAFDLSNIDEDISRLNQYADALGRNADEATELKATFDIENRARSTFSEVYAKTGGDLIRAAEAANAMRLALHRVADESLRMRGLQELTRGLGQAGQNALESLIRGGSSFHQILGQLLQDIALLIAKLTIINPLMNSLTHATGTNALPTLDIFGSILGKGIDAGAGSLFSSTGSSVLSAGFSDLPFLAADGANVNAGDSVVVGDGGEPELFVPKTAGEIIPFSKLGRTNGSPIGGGGDNGGGGGVLVRVEAGPMFETTMKRISSDQAERTVKNYDQKTLPSRVAQIAAQPHRR